MHRIDTTDTTARWRYKCPECRSTDWRVNNGSFGCRACSALLHALLDDKTGDRVPREQIEFVGPEAAKGAYPARGISR